MKGPLMNKIESKEGNLFNLDFLYVEDVKQKNQDFLKELKEDIGLNEMLDMGQMILLCKVIDEKALENYGGKLI